MPCIWVDPPKIGTALAVNAQLPPTLLDNILHKDIAFRSNLNLLSLDKNMTKFRPCIDLHGGQVKQIVGGTLSFESENLQTNHISTESAAYFARLYRKNNLRGGHVIMLGPGNENAAREALKEWPAGLQVGGGINAKNARQWISAGAEKVIVTSFLFPDANFSQQRVEEIYTALGKDRNKLVIDLSCRTHGDDWVVAINKWQTLTNTCLNRKFIQSLEPYCSEFLIHAADKEGLQAGIDEDLIRKLAQWCSVDVTYAGGGKNIDALQQVDALSNGRVDLTIGSALDIFGGTAVTLAECVEFNKWH